MTPRPYHKLALCPCCEGTGRTSAWLGDVTNMANDDPDFAEEYMAGAYDRPCHDCEGSGRIQVLQPGAPFALRRQLVQARREAQYREYDAKVRAAEMGWGHA